MSQKPKFYFFDTGVVRALSRTLSVNLIESTYAFGDAFEHHVILECFQLASYYQREFKFSYIKTQNDLEIDLVIEIKSSTQVTPKSLSSFIRLSKDLEGSEVICLSRDPYPKIIEHIKIMPWQEGLRKIFIDKT